MQSHQPQTGLHPFAEKGRSLARFIGRNTLKLSNDQQGSTSYGPVQEAPE